MDLGKMFTFFVRISYNTHSKIYIMIYPAEWRTKLLGGGSNVALQHNLPLNIVFLIAENK